MSAQRRDFDETKLMSFLINDDELTEKHNKFCKKSAAESKKDFIVTLCTMKNV